MNTYTIHPHNRRQFLADILQVSRRALPAVVLAALLLIAAPMLLPWSDTDTSRMLLLALLALALPLPLGLLSLRLAASRVPLLADLVALPFAELLRRALRCLRAAPAHALFLFVPPLAYIAYNAAGAGTLDEYGSLHEQASLIALMGAVLLLMQFQQVLLPLLLSVLRGVDPAEANVLAEQAVEDNEGLVQLLTGAPLLCFLPALVLAGPSALVLALMLYALVPGVVLAFYLYAFHGETLDQTPLDVVEND